MLPKWLRTRGPPDPELFFFFARRDASTTLTAYVRFPYVNVLAVAAPFGHQGVDVTVTAPLLVDVVNGIPAARLGIQVIDPGFTTSLGVQVVDGSIAASLSHRVVFLLAAQRLAGGVRLRDDDRIQLQDRETQQ